MNLSIPVAARSKARVCGRSLAGIVGSIPPGAWKFVYCECCVSLGRGLRRADHSFRRVLPSVVCPIKCDRNTPQGEAMIRKRVEAL